MSLFWIISEAKLGGLPHKTQESKVSNLRLSLHCGLLCFLLFLLVLSLGEACPKSWVLIFQQQKALQAMDLRWTMKDLIYTNITNISNRDKSIRNLLQELLRFTSKVSPPWLARFEWQLGQPQPSQHVIPPLETLVPPKMTACKKSVGHQGAAAACAATLRCCPGASKVMWNSITLHPNTLTSHSWRSINSNFPSKNCQAKVLWKRLHRLRHLSNPPTTFHNPQPPRWFTNVIRHFRPGAQVPLLMHLLEDLESLTACSDQNYYLETPNWIGIWSLLSQICGSQKCYLNFWANPKRIHSW